MKQQAYRGPQKLIIALDIGTTFSGASFVVCKHGEEPKIVSVHKFPDQILQAPKVPSVLIYNGKGDLKYVGAGAVSVQAKNDLDENPGWVKVERFKLHLCPHLIPSSFSLAPSSPDNGSPAIPHPFSSLTLPTSKSLLAIFADYISYLFHSTRLYFTRTQQSAEDTWTRLISSAVFVLTHPNGWGGPQQAKLRDAVVMAGLVEGNVEGRARVRFVSEGEAALNYCLNKGYIDEVIFGDAGDAFVVADLGGGTLDFSAYRIKKRKPLVVEESAITLCEVKGSTFVTAAAMADITRKLHNSKFNTPEFLSLIEETFDKETKPFFSNAEDDTFIRIGSPHERDADVGVRRGQMKISGRDMASYFEPCVAAAANCAKVLVASGGGIVTGIYLVGGFTASRYMVSEFKKRLDGMAVNVPEGFGKAVADGAVCFYLDNFVSSRVAKWTYGSYVTPEYQSSDPEHVERKKGGEVVVSDISGKLFVDGGFEVCVEKGTAVTEQREFVQSYYYETTNLEEVELEHLVAVYMGDGEVPKWITESNSEQFRTLMTLSADPDDLRQNLIPAVGPNGRKFWYQDYQFSVSLGLTEIKASLSWFGKNKKVMRTPARVVYDELVDDEDGGQDEDGDEEMTPPVEIQPRRKRQASVVNVSPGITRRTTSSRSSSVSVLQRKY